MFRIERSDNIPWEAVYYLKKAIKRTPACVETIESIVAAIEQGSGELYLIKGDKVYGASFISISEGYLNVVLLGGDKIQLWKDVYWQFLLDKMKESNTRLLVVGRKGWEKIFPLKNIGSIFTF